jgi:hypothetical protein
MTITPATFAYSGNFTGLSDTQIQTGIDAVYTMWFGVVTAFWARLGATIRDAKRLLAWNLLAAWWLANQYPTNVTGGITTNGGFPLTSKSIGGTSISFKDVEAQRGMEALQSNTFGMEAYTMIISAEEMYTVYG